MVRTRASDAGPGWMPCSSESFRYGFRRHYSVRPWTDFMEIYWGPGCQFYVTPVGGGEACVALITRDPHLRLDTALTRFPELARRLDGAPVISQERGSVTVTRRLKRIYQGRTVLLGDASGSVDAITGEGMSLSFRQAHSARRCVGVGRPGAISNRASPHEAPSRLHGPTDVAARSISGSSPPGASDVRGQASHL